MTEQKRFTLRMDNDLFERVKDQAEVNKRSIAKEIEYLIEKYFQEKDSQNKSK